MQITIILFYVFGVLAAISALFIASTRNVIYAAFALILCFIALAGVYVFLRGRVYRNYTNTSLCGWYSGVLLVFVVMLTNRVKGDKILTLNQNKLSVFLSVAVFILLFKGILAANFAGLEWINQDKTSKVGLKGFGLNLMTEYVLAFEMIGLLVAHRLNWSGIYCRKKKGGQSCL